MVMMKYVKVKIKKGCSEISTDLHESDGILLIFWYLDG